MGGGLIPALPPPQPPAPPHRRREAHPHPACGRVVCGGAAAERGLVHPSAAVGADMAPAEAETHAALGAAGLQGGGALRHRTDIACSPAALRPQPAALLAPAALQPPEVSGRRWGGAQDTGGGIGIEDAVVALPPVSISRRSRAGASRGDHQGCAFTL
eukprot:scaffold7409_cov75-Isochrysis_galbana.AAC.3